MTVINGGADDGDEGASEEEAGGEDAGGPGVAEDDAASHSTEREGVTQKWPRTTCKARAGQGVGRYVSPRSKAKHSQKEFDEKLSKG